MRIKPFIVNLLNRLSWGQFIISKVQFIITLVILLKVFNVKPYVYLIAGIFALIFVYIIGFVFDQWFKEDYHKKYYGKFKF